MTARPKILDRKVMRIPLTPEIKAPVLICFSLTYWIKTAYIKLQLWDSTLILYNTHSLVYKACLAYRERFDYSHQTTAQIFTLLNTARCFSYTCEAHRLASMLVPEGKPIYVNGPLQKSCVYIHLYQIHKIFYVNKIKQNLYLCNVTYKIIELNSRKI